MHFSLSTVQPPQRCNQRIENFLSSETPKRISSDVKEEHTPSRDEIAKFILGSARPDKPSRPRSGKSKSNIDDIVYNYRMGRERMTVVRDATGHDSTVTSNTNTNFK